MRTKKSLIFLIVIITLTPIISVFGTTIPVETTVSANYWDADVNVQAGDTIYYDIDQLVLPPEADPEGVTLPDFAGNQIFIKIEAVYENYIFPDALGTVIYYAAGLLFGEEETFTVGEGLLKTDFIIPAGAATPSVGVMGAPHFNGTDVPPMVFVVNDAWATHEFMLEAIGFTVTNDASTFSVSLVNGTGLINAAWRKSDGVCTHIIFDDIEFMGMNLTDTTIELTLDRVEYNPLPVTVGDFVEFTADIANVDVTGTGDLYSSINQTSLNSFLDDLASLEGEVFQKLIIDQVIGLYYSCSVYMYSFETEALEKIAEDIVYNGFLGVVQASYDPFYYALSSSPEALIPEGPSYTYFPYFAPFVTPDWEIYEGHMNLYDTMLGVYVVDILELFSIPTDALTYHALGGGFDFVQKRDFYYLQEHVTYDVEENYDYSSSIIISAFLGQPDMVYDDGSRITVEEEGYICYTSDGIPAAIAVRADVELAYYDSASPASGTGTLELHIDFKLRNPLYDPPELIQGGIFPGFTWIIAIPAIFAVAMAGVVYRKKKKK